MQGMIKAIFKTGSGSLISIILGIISTKIMAIVIGSSGIGLFSLIRQTLTTVTTAGTMGGQTALVQGLASKQADEKDKYLITVFWIFILGAIVCTLGLILLAPWIAQIVFSSNDEQNINLVRWMALPVILIIIYYYLISVLNGFRAIGRLAMGQVIVSMITAFLAFPISKLVSSGYVISFIWMISASTIGGIIFCFIIAYKEKWLNPLFEDFKPIFHKNAIKHFYHIASTTFISGIIATGILLIIRAMIVKYGGFSSAGIFDVAWTLSMMYITLLLSSFGTYYLPTLSGINKISSRITLIQNLLKLSLLLVVPLIITVIVLKPLVITVLYTSEFIPALEIIRWMLMGDYFKVSSWVLAMPMLAYADMKSFFWTELFWNMGFLIMSSVAVFYYNDLQIIGIAFLLLYAIYFVYTIFYAYKKHKVVLANKVLVHWLLGLLLIVLASLQTWNNRNVDWISAPIWIGIAIGFSWMALNKNEKSKLSKMIYKKGD